MTVLDIPITSLTIGVVKSTDVYPAVDVTDTTQSPAGTTKQYLISDLASFIGGGGGGGITWNSVAGTTQTMAINNGYVPTNIGLTTFTLPSTCAFGAVLEIAGMGSGGWTIAQNAGQMIRWSTQVTTTGIGGSISSTNSFQAIRLLCIVANTTFEVLSATGNLTVV